MKFEVGDKVLIHDSEGDSRYNGKVGIVINTGRIKRIGGTWDYLCKFKNSYDYPFGPSEMTKINTKGQQLLFSFMKQ